jgi:uncharacterized protein YkwD
MLTRGLFPRGLFFRGAFGVLTCAAVLSLTGAVASATGGTKPAARPVARLLSTSRQEVPARTRARLEARIVPVSTAYAASPSAAATGDERRTFELINAERQRRGRRPLAWDGSLTRMARYHSANMAREGFFNHVDRDGLDLTGRAELLGLRGWKSLGENIAYNQGYSDPQAFAVERWMISDKHRENILNGEFTHAGLGIARAADGRVFFTQVFMKR